MIYSRRSECARFWQRIFERDKEDEEKARRRPYRPSRCTCPLCVSESDEVAAKKARQKAQIVTASSIRLALFFSLSLSSLAGADIRVRLLRLIRPLLPSRAQITIDDIRVPLPKNVNYQLTLLSPHPPIGMISFLATPQTPQAQKKIYGTAHIKVVAPVAVAKGPIRNDELFSERNVTLAPRELNLFLTSGFFSETRVLIKLKARGFIREGSVIGLANTFIPSVINAGQMVRLVFRKELLQVSARVRALEGGTLDHWIRVENPSTKKTLLAKVIGEGEVSTY